MTTSNDRQLKVAYLIDAFEWGGAESAIAKLVSHAEGHARHVVYTFRRPGVLAERLPAPQVAALSDWKGPGFGSKSAKPQLLLRLSRTLLLLPVFLARMRKDQPDIVLTIGFPASLFGAVASVFFRRTAYLYRFSNLRGRLLPGEGRFFRWVFSRYTRLICVSDAVRESVLDQFPCLARKCVVIHNGTELLPKSSATRAPAARGATFISLARFDPVKKHEELIAAFEAHHSQCGRCRLVLAGDGPRRSAIQELVRARGLEACVELCGHTKAPWDLLVNSDVLVSASHEEGLSNAVLEAMAASLPVLAYDIASMREILSNSVEGFLIPCADTGGLSAAMGRLCRSSELRSRMGAAARKRVATGFSISAMATAYQRCFLEAAETAQRAQNAFQACPEEGWP